MEIGNKVRLVPKPVEGVITDTRYNKEQKCLEHFVEYGEDHSRWFSEIELELNEVAE